MLNKIIEAKISDLRTLMSKRHISKAYLFGSCLKNYFTDEKSGV